ncbi:unnamed protein product, partial [Timema podura]|nr:unnamed protein product [Timema podura]
DLVFEKAYCQYRLNQPQEALKTLDLVLTLSLKLKELKAQILYRLERFYRLNQPQEALKTLDLVLTLSLKLKELKAQILYRLERYEECFDVYRDIIKNSNDDYEEERETNLSAVIANMCHDD